jgi:hypothetical protein
MGRRLAFALVLGGLLLAGMTSGAVAQQPPQLEKPPVFVDPDFRIEKHFRIERDTSPPEHGYLFWSEPVRDRIADRVRPNSLPAEDMLSAVLVFLKDSPMRPDGAAAIEVRRKIDCATRTVTWDSYSTYSETGQLLKQDNAPPREIALLAEPSEGRVNGWARLCDPPPTSGWAVPARPPSPDGKNWPSYFMLAPKPARTVAEAISHARDRERYLVQARTPLPAGEFAPYPAGTSIIMMDYKNRPRSGVFTQMTWLETPVWRTHYTRHVYNVDCASKTAAQKLRANYNKDGQLNNVSGGYPVTTFKLTGNEEQLQAACSWPRPNPSRKSHETETDALAAARQMVAEVEAKIGPERSLADFARETGAIEVRPGEFVSKNLQQLLDQVKPKAAAPLPPPIVRLDRAQ